MSKPVNTVMIFAAGFGTRMGSLTKDRPKPLVTVGGRSLIDHTLDLISEIDPDRVVMNLHYKASMIRDHLTQFQILFSEEKEILETGGGLHAALPLLGSDPVFTTNSDAIWKGPNPLALLRDHWEPSKMEALLLTVPLSHTDGHTGTGDFIFGPENRLSRGPGEVYTGIQILKTDRLKAIGPGNYSLRVVWDQMIADGTIYGLSYTGSWCDVGNPDGIILAEEMLGRDANDN